MAATITQERKDRVFNGSDDSLRRKLCCVAYLGRAEKRNEGKEGEKSYSKVYNLGREFNLGR